MNTNSSTAHRELMTSYYQLQAPIYELSRRLFLFGREQIVRDLDLKQGETVIDVGCGTGWNFPMIRRAIGETGELIALECSEAMLRKARERVRNAGWKNVHIVDHEYGSNTITRGEANAVLFSYSLSMIPSWHAALNSAREDLKSDGRIGIVDFCSLGTGRLARLFAEWMSWNHVDVDRPYRHILDRQFRTHLWARPRVWGGAWSYFRYAGFRSPAAGFS